MTEIQSMMLAVCFGGVMGTFIANVVFLIQCAVKNHREKKRKKMEQSADKAE